MFRRSIPKYKAIRIDRTLQPDPPTDAMFLGDVTHCRILEPAKFAERFAVRPVDLTPPKVDRRTKAGKSELAAWEAANAEALRDFAELVQGRTLLDPETLALVNGMFEGCMKNPMARKILEHDGLVEHRIDWDCPETGQPLKMRADKILSNGMLVDLKTTQDPSPSGFKRAIGSFKYHRQAALYLEGAATGVPFVFMAVAKEYPHECVLHTLDAAAMEVGRQQNISTLLELADCRAKDCWEDRHSNAIHEIQLSTWDY